MSITLRMTFQPYGATPPAVIEVTSTSFDGEQTLNVGSSSTGAGAGKVTFNPFTFTRKPDAHSPDFFTRLCSGTPFQKVLLEVATAGATTPFFAFTMGLAAVKTIAVTASEPDGYPSEIITLEYGQAAYSVTPQNSDGTFGKTVASAWDRIKNISIDPTKVGTI